MQPGCSQRWRHVLRCLEQGFLHWQACPPGLRWILDHFARRQSHSRSSSSRQWVLSMEVAGRWLRLTAAIKLLNELTAILIQMWNLA